MLSNHTSPFEQSLQHVSITENEPRACSLSHADVPDPTLHRCIINDVVVASAPLRALVNTGADTCFLANDFSDEVNIACGARSAHSATLADGLAVEMRGSTTTLTVKLASRQ